jgi:hypothetical protein
LNVFRIGCERCGRAGSYRRGGLVKRFGGGIALPDLLGAIIAVAAVLATTAQVFSPGRLPSSAVLALARIA